ncbi:unnamed protein product, partial [Rotaria magnacalcarata]
ICNAINKIRFIEYYSIDPDEDVDEANNPINVQQQQYTSADESIVPDAPLEMEIQNMPASFWNTMKTVINIRCNNPS